MTCKPKDYDGMRHDEVKDIAAQVFKEACQDVTAESLLLPLQGERITTKASRDAGVDVITRSFCAQSKEPSLT